MANCPSCNQEKEDKEFYKHKGRSTGLSAWCKTCELIKRKKWKKENSDKIRNNNYRHLYGITLEKYNEMFLNQKGCCAICGIHANEFVKKLSVDHCHATGTVRGLLCHSCNTTLGNMNDDVNLLKKAIKYLEEKNEQP